MKNLYLTLAMVLICYATSHAQWLSGSTPGSIYYNNYVGVGTDSPTDLFQVNYGASTKFQVAALRGIWVNNEINGGTASSPADLYLNHSSTGNTLINSLGGNVGIGTNNPSAARLMVVDNANTFSGFFLGRSAGVALGGSTTIAQIQGYTSATATGDVSLQPNAGNVLIGQTSQTSTANKLDVNGIIHNYVVADANIKISKPTGAAIQFDDGAGNQNALIEAGSATNNLQFFTNHGSGLVEGMRILNNGNLLIGQTSQMNSLYKLDVAGAVRANEVVVNTSGADFVFDKKYKLPRLAIIKTYIEKNHHLPEVVSADEMSKDGVALGELNTKLLQKVEELTLYIIQQKEQSDSEFKLLKKQLSEQRRQVFKLKSLHKISVK